MQTAIWISWWIWIPAPNHFDRVGPQQFLEDKLGCKVNVVPSEALPEELRPSVFSEAIYL